MIILRVREVILGLKIQTTLQEVDKAIRSVEDAELRSSHRLSNT